MKPLNVHKMNVIWALLFWYLRTSAAQSSNCNFYQQVTATARYTISSPNYPANYTGALQCRWIADCPEGYNCRLDCPDIWLPQSPNCTSDKLLVSKSGDPQLAAAEVYCGRGTLSVVSTRQRISIGLITSSNTKGGRFTCEISAQPVTSAPNCYCGVRRQNRIVGGHDTEINEYPMMVGLVDVRIRQIKCGAVIISSYHVLTAAHCLTYLELSKTAVIVGEHDTSQGESPATAAYNVNKFEIHPLFSNTTNDYDIGIVTVAGPIVFSDRVGPVCLPFKYTLNDFASVKVTVLGWGTLFPGGPDSKVLQEVDLDVITEMQCRYKEPSVTNRQICTFTRGKDACQDDSGGPLLYTDPSTALLFVVGIVSNGRSCASPDYPGINTRVTQFLNWITTNTRVSYCVK